MPLLDGLRLLLIRALLPVDVLAQEVQQVLDRVNFLVVLGNCI